MKVLAFDIATTTGVAVGSPGGAPVAWAECLGEEQEEDLLFSRMLILTSKLIEEHDPVFIAYEAAIGGPRTSQFLVGMVACVRGCAKNRGIDARKCNIGAIRKHFIGRHITSADYGHLAKHRRRSAARAAAKQAVQQRCGQLGWGSLSEDAADACAVWDYACSTVLPKYQSAPLGELFS